MAIEVAQSRRPHFRREQWLSAEVEDAIVWRNEEIVVSLSKLRVHAHVHLSTV